MNWQEKLAAMQSLEPNLLEVTETWEVKWVKTMGYVRVRCLTTPNGRCIYGPQPALWPSNRRRVGWDSGLSCYIPRTIRQAARELYQQETRRRLDSQGGEGE